MKKRYHGASAHGPPHNAARRNDGTAVRRPPNAGGVQDHVSGGDNGVSTGSRALLSLASRQLVSYHSNMQRQLRNGGAGGGCGGGGTQ
eukprot:scaffold8493_cov67-Phaeocystis_antarctica.AAC.2